MKFAISIDQLEQKIDEISTEYKIESDSNIISKHLDINYIVFSPTEYSELNNNSLGTIK